MADQDQRQPGPPPLRLPELLEGGWRLLDEVEAGSAHEPSSGAVPVQRQVQQGLRLLERAARAVAELQLFSHNEELEEIASADLKFMLVPALLAALILKQVSPDKRLEHVQRARASFMDFLKVCKDYGIGHFELPQESDHLDEDQSAGSSQRVGPTSDQAALIAMATNRQAKIERYKQKKEVENRLASLKTSVDGGHADEEQIREYYLLQIKKWISTSLEEIESIDQEIAILSRREALKQVQRPSTRARPPMKPFILTRDAAQAKVFGTGYPSLATMTVDDWYEQRQKQGVLPDQGIPQRPAGTEEEEEKKEEEEESETAVWRAREWDEWKDTHPRGYGNRKNMG
ncbi:immunoglobulin-binding protein 1 isoform X2 [Hemicordylus capensis]|uniref:immunoglobulin-binding protein 1 isoform X2 n=1 Tax=Hemicordylus capensis TaxID=884348 RepID=UPI00230461B4|nr:immunoglobulin-binding protein 1 isoform X2 [Hemicordylus capensis]